MLAASLLRRAAFWAGGQEEAGTVSSITRPGYVFPFRHFLDLLIYSLLIKYFILIAAGIHSAL